MISFVFICCVFRYKRYLCYPLRLQRYNFFLKYAREKKEKAHFRALFFLLYPCKLCILTNFRIFMRIYLRNPKKYRTFARFFVKITRKANMFNPLTGLRYLDISIFRYLVESEPTPFSHGRKSFSPELRLGCL